MQTQTQKDAFNVIGIKVQVNDPEKAHLILGDAWKRFLEENILATIPNKINEEDIVSVYADYKPDISFSPIE